METVTAALQPPVTTTTSVSSDKNQSADTAAGSGWGESEDSDDIPKQEQPAAVLGPAAAAGGDTSVKELVSHKEESVGVQGAEPVVDSEPQTAVPLAPHSWIPQVRSQSASIGLRPCSPPFLLEALK